MRLSREKREKKRGNQRRMKRRVERAEVEEDKYMWFIDKKTACNYNLKLTNI